MVKFEVGKSYEASMADISSITVIKRTPKYCYVTNDVGNTWRMLIREKDGTEYMTDSCVPKRWQQAYTYSAKYEIGG